MIYEFMVLQNTVGYNAFLPVLVLDSSVVILNIVYCKGLNMRSDANANANENANTDFKFEFKFSSRSRSILRLVFRPQTRFWQMFSMSISAKLPGGWRHPAWQIFQAHYAVCVCIQQQAYDRPCTKKKWSKPRMLSSDTYGLTVTTVALCLKIKIIMHNCTDPVALVKARNETWCLKKRDCTLCIKFTTATPTCLAQKDSHSITSWAADITED